uniref:Protein kinase domain-containing protein n=1 Tax=Rhizophora mucronata TaxID=61149 RepID=A0A2P2J8X4_RHIMU
MFFSLIAILFVCDAGHLTRKSDVYSFGVVFLEMLSGRPAIDKNRPSREQSLVEWARPYLSSKRRFVQVLDARIEGQYSMNSAQKAVNLAVQCLSTEPRFRPNTQEVVKTLEQLQDANETAELRGSQRQNPEKVHHKSSKNPGSRTKVVNEVRNGKPASFPKPSTSPLRA